MDLATRTLLIAGAFLNLCALAYLLGIAYIVPLAFSRTAGDQMLLLFFSALITLSTLLSWYYFRRDNPIIATVVMYAWWLAAIWFLNRVAFGVF